MLGIPAAVEKVAGVFDTVLDKIWPDAAERQKHALELAQLAYKEIELSNADRDSARQREMAVKDLTPTVLAYGITVGFFGIVWFMMTNDVPSDSQRILDMLLGSLITAWTGVIAYYFGSSAGSAAKHQMIERLTK